MPLLIGGATTSRAAHRGEDRAGVSREPTVHVLDASRAVSASWRRCSIRKQTREFDREEPRRSRSACASCTRGRRASRCCRSARRRPNRPRHRLARRGRARSRAFLGRRVLETCRSRELVAVHRLDLLLHGVGADAAGSRRSSSIPSTARRRASCTTQRDRSCSQRIVDEKLLTRARGLRLLAGQRATATTSSCTPTRRARRS